MVFKMTDGTKLSTKDKIVNSAFSFYTTVLQRKVSLSEIAERTGITKAAIYKHFKSREELEQTMSEKLKEELLSIINDVDANMISKGNSSLKRIVVLLSEKKTYLYYFLSNLSDAGIESYFLQLKNSGVSSLNSLFDENDRIVSFDLYKDFLYVSFCVIFFIISRDIALTCRNMEDSKEELAKFADGVVRFINKGIYCNCPSRARERVSGLLRLCQLDRMIASSVAMIPEPERELKALASCAKKIGFTKITVESIASELGLAKSSLYSKFSSKSELVSSSLKSSMRHLLEAVMSNIVNSESPSESIYIILKTSFDFFMKRPDLLILSRLIQFNEPDFFLTCGEHQQDKEFYKFLCNCDILGTLPDFGKPELGADYLYASLFCIPIYLITQTSSSDFTVEELQSALKEYYYMIVLGKSQGKGE